MRNNNSVNVARRHVLAHCTVLAAALWGGGFGGLGAQTPPTILVVGDSLSAEYGLKRGSGWVALMEARLAEQKMPFHVVNASVSGDTTSGGRSRLPALLARHQPSHVVIELGGNDALRGLAISMTEANLAAMTQAALDSGARVTLVGMQVPPNYGAAYGRDFVRLFASVAQSKKAALVPFLLKGVADAPDAPQWFQPDRIHPTERAHPLMLDNVWPVLRPQLK
jgi:acyl-CoA thioesterase-1